VLKHLQSRYSEQIGNWCKNCNSSKKRNSQTKKLSFPRKRETRGQLQGLSSTW